jgi:hypothetical protein
VDLDLYPRVPDPRLMTHDATPNAGPGGTKKA